MGALVCEGEQVLRETKSLIFCFTGTIVMYLTSLVFRQQIIQVPQTTLLADDIDWFNHTKRS